jgi:hypothetical protein
VELDLRNARLKVIRDKWDDRKDLSADQLRNVGARAVAIVDGNENTVTSTAEFKNEHIVSVLSRAEAEAGLPLTDKAYLLTFTDLVDCAAAAQVKYVSGRLDPLIFYLKKGVAEGELPVPERKVDPTSYASTVYTDTSKQSAQKAEPMDALSSTGALNPKMIAYLKRCG